jgi:hypothetical protein
MPFRKYRLLGYDIDEFQPLSDDGVRYVLTIEVWTYWGGVKKTITRPEVLPYHMNAETFWGPKLNKWIHK